MIPDKLEQEAKKLKDSIIESINQFRYETNLTPMIDVKIKETTVSCQIIRHIEVSVTVPL